jgi:hypothetical protein
MTSGKAGGLLGEPLKVANLKLGFSAVLAILSRLFMCYQGLELIKIENILASGLNFFVVIAPPSKIPV